MKLANALSALAVVVSAGAIVVTGASWNAAQSETDPTAPLRQELQLQSSDLKAATKRVDVLEAALEKADKRIVVLVKQSKADEIMRQCVKEFGNQAQGMSVEYGYAAPDTALSAPCQEYLWGDDVGHD
jgi:hypothetical protein